MMIHVFYVNRGDMLMFDMSHAVERWVVVTKLEFLYVSCKQSNPYLNFKSSWLWQKWCFCQLLMSIKPVAVMYVCGRSCWLLNETERSLNCLLFFPGKNSIAAKCKDILQLSCAVSQLSILVDSVTKLQQVISSETGIPFESQVLLISGGETMSPNSRVCSYSAGTVSMNVWLVQKGIE